MDMKTLANGLTSRFAKQVLIAQKNSPVMLIGASVVGVVATVVLASRATLKMAELLEENAKDVLKVDHAVRMIAEGREKELSEYEANLAKRNALSVRLEIAVKIVKLYAPAVIVGAATVGAMTGSHIILSRRNAGLTAAYAAVDKGFREYRARVVSDLGIDKDEEYYRGLVDKEIVEETEEGQKITTMKVVDPSKGGSPYSFCFDESNPNWNREQSYNQTFILVQQQYANDRLLAKGHLMLNDVLRSLGMKETPAGAVTGWVRNNESGGDNYVSFGVFRNEDMGEMFVSGQERSIWLNFNVDGVVWDKIGKGSN